MGRQTKKLASQDKEIRSICPSILDILIECRFGNSNHLTDLINVVILFIIQFRDQFPFVLVKGLWAPTFSSSRLRRLKSYLRSFPDQISFKLSQGPKQVEHQLTSNR